MAMRRTEEGGRASGVLSYFARHATAANLVLLVLLAVGIATFPRMRAQFFPDTVIEQVTVSVAWPGAGADEVDHAIVQLLEPALLAVEGVEGTTSRSSEGRATISLDFEPGTDMARAVDDVQSAVDGVSNLPADAETPEVSRRAWRDRVTDVVITGPVGLGQLARFADEMVVRLFAEGVTRATISGVVAPQTVVEVPVAALIRNDVSMQQIADAIAEEAAADPAGSVEGANLRVRTGVEKHRADEIAGIVLRSNPDGSKLTVGDVGTLRVEGIGRTSAYYVGSDPAVKIRVDRSDRGDAIKIQGQVQQIADEMVKSLPQGVKIDLIRTRAEIITGRLKILMENGAQGLAMVLLLLFLFLNARTALWVAAGIPVSMLTALALMYAGGLTLNIISLFALIITLGIVVDDAIVVGEHADFRARRLGEAPQVAAERAAIWMAAPVFSATLTTIIAFFGLAAIGGRFGSLIFDIPFTVIAVLTASLVECFLILPRHMVHALEHSAKRHWYDWPNRTVNAGFRRFRDAVFRPVMRLVVRARYPVLAGAVLLLAFAVSALIRGDVPWRFFSSPERSSISANFAMLEGATRADTMAQMEEVQRAVADLGARYKREYGRDPVDYVLAQVGGTTGRGLAGAETKSADLLGSIAIELIDADLRPYSSAQFVSALQDEVRKLPRTETVSFRGWHSGPGGDSLSVEFSGADAATLKRAAEALETAVAAYPEVSAVEDTLAYDKDELILDLTPQGQALGFTIDGLGRVLRHRLGGIEAATYPDGNRSAAIRVELPKGELTADFLDRTMMRTGAGDWVPLADLVNVKRQSGFSTVRRENGVRVVTVSGEIDDTDPERAVAINESLRDRILPDIAERYGVAYLQAGLNQQEGEFLADAKTGFVLCLLGIYLVLAWIFASWTRPLIVMAIIPFGLVGAVWGHAHWDIALSMFSVVGLIGMTGIIINDAIVLVSTIDDYAKDRGLIPAIVDGTADRLRPVFLTTATTVMGLAPLLYNRSSDAQFLKPTVVTLVYGLGFGMFLVLLIVPALMAVQLDVGRQMHALRRAFSRRRSAAPAALAAGVAAAGGLALFAATMGPALVTGTVSPVVAAVFPGLAHLPAIAAGFLAFAVAMLALVILVYIGVALAWRGRSDPKP